MVDHASFGIDDKFRDDNKNLQYGGFFNWYSLGFL